MKKFIKALQEIDIELNDKQIKQFDIYYKTLIEWNEKMNLTALTELEDVYFKHFLDSIYLAKSLPLESQSLLDVGSGAGFPSIPLKIIFPTLRVTIIDALKKRIGFLEHLTNLLDIEVNLIHGRAEEFKKKESFDIVTARAVANLNMLSELCVPFVRKDGYFITLKGSNYEKEIELIDNALNELNFELDNVYTYKILGVEHVLLRFIKTGITPSKYPRKFKKIKSTPL